MRKVYEDQDMTMVGYYQSLLEGEGIKTMVKNEYASLATGEIPFTQVYPELWVSDDADYESSVELIRSLRDSPVVEEQGEQQQDQEVEHEQEVKRPISYQRSPGVQLVLWFGTLFIILMLLYAANLIIQALL